MLLFLLSLLSVCCVLAACSKRQEWLNISLVVHSLGKSVTVRLSVKPAVVVQQRTTWYTIDHVGNDWQLFTAGFCVFQSGVQFRIFCTDVIQQHIGVGS